MALNNIDVQISAKANNARKEVNNLKNDMRGLKKETNGVGQSITNAFKSGNIYGALQKSAIFGWIGAIKNATQAMIKATSAESDYAESLNLLNVAYDNNTESATKLISKMEKMYGLDPAGLTKQLGIYKQMTNAMGMSSDASALLSENLLKMQEDVSSLYNLDIETVANKFQSALAGQTRAVRSLGVDITQASLQQELYNRGIDKSVSELNRASKTALIYLTMERQLANANGDAANTVNHLANQVRIFKEQIAIAGRQIGAVFIPILQAILPYLNGILMAINEIGKALLGMLGVDVNEMAKTTGISVNAATGGVGGLGDAIGGASKKAKDLNKELKQLRGFDKLNVINTPSNSGSSGGGAGGAGGGVSGGGIDPALWKQLKEYDLKDVSMRAQQIKDAFLEWLKVFKPLEEPFKKLSELTFDGLKYLWNDILKPVGKWANSTLLPKIVEVLAKAMEAVYETAKTMQPILLNIMEKVVKPFGRVLGRTIINMLNLIKNAFDAISKSKLLQYLLGSAGLIVAFTKLVGVGKELATWFGATKLGGIFKTFNGTLIDAFKGAKNVKQGFKDYFDLIVNEGGKTAKSIMGLKINTDALQAAVSGAIQTALGISMVTASIQDMQENGFSLISTITLVAGAIETAIGAVQLFTGAIGVLKTLITASNPFSLAAVAIIGTLGLIYALEQAKVGYQQYIISNEQAKDRVDKLTKSIKDENKAIEDNYKHKLLANESNKEYLEELKKITDANGKIKKGYEDRASFIVGQLNEAYGTEIKIIDGVIVQYKKQIEALENVIQAETAKIYLDMQKEKVQKAIERETELLEAQAKAEQNLKYQQEEQQKASDKLKYAQEKLAETSVWNTEEYNLWQNAVISAKKELGKHDDAVRQATQTFDDATKAYNDNLAERVKYQEMWVEYSQKHYDNVEDIAKNGVENITAKTHDELVRQTKTIRQLQGNDIISAWKWLASRSNEEYKRSLEQLPLSQQAIIKQAVNGIDNDKSLANSFEKLGKESEQDFIEEFAKMPEDIRRTVTNNMSEEGKQIVSRLQSEIDKKTVTVKVNADTAGIVSAIRTSINGRKFNVETDTYGNVRLRAAAEGGFLNTGEMFIAREAGPELVGRIGNRTAVANNDQIVNSIAKGLAMSGIGKDTNVTIVAKEKAGLLDYIEFEQQKRNRQYGL